jgi:tetratricopeptide (TPR) repeat protein
LPDAEAAPEVDLLAQLLTQIARAQGLQKRFDEAHATLDRAQGLLDRTSSRAATRYWLERGRAFRSGGRPDEARPCFVRALESARAAALDGYAVDALHMLALVETGEASLDWSRQALVVAQSSTQPEALRWRASLLNNIGWHLHDLGRPAEALEHFQRAVPLRQEQGDAYTLRVAEWCVARALRSLGRLEEALTQQRALLARAEASQDEDGFIHEELGELLLALGQGPEARPHFARASQLLAEELADQPERLARLRALGGLADAPPA